MPNPDPVQPPTKENDISEWKFILSDIVLIQGPPNVFVDDNLFSFGLSSRCFNNHPLGSRRAFRWGQCFNCGCYGLALLL